MVRSWLLDLLLQIIKLLLGRICNEYGDFIPEGTPPQPQPTSGNPWEPYSNRIDFELARFFYKESQSSATEIDSILHLWKASLEQHGDIAPFKDHQELYATIDATPLGDTSWDSFNLHFSGEIPEGEPPEWMTTDFEYWYRDPRALVHGILANPDFAHQLDYAPYQEYVDGKHIFSNMMSGDWAWKQAVSRITL